MIKYYRIELSKKFLKGLIEDENDFVLKETSYTKIFKIKGNTFVFNEDGKQDLTTLKLINKVKSDVKKIDLPDTPENPIHWYLYNDINGNINDKGKLLKLDLNEAYWSYARRMNVIKSETHESFLQTSHDLEPKERKALRLKALGSLATKKTISIYESGLLIDVKHEVNKINLAHYKNICFEVDKLLKNALINFDLLYYYWDCLFINDEKKLNKIKDFIKSEGLNFKINADFYTVVKSNYINFIRTHSKGYDYPINKNDILFNKGN